MHQTGKQLIAMAIVYGVLSASGGGTLAQTLGPQGNPSPQAKRPTVPGADGHPSEKFEKDSLVVTSEYYIGPEDVLEIIVWRNQDLSKVVTVRPDGRISLPLLGDIEATGLTPSELTANIVNRLKQFKETPTVSVILQQVNSYGIYVLGETQKPGRYYLKSKTTLLQAITMAADLHRSPRAIRLSFFGGVKARMRSNLRPATTTLFSETATIRTLS